MEKIPFFISPPYHVFKITCSLLVMLNAATVSELRPNSLKFSTLALDALYTMKSGSKFASSSADGWMNMFFTKCACQATSMMKRTESLVSAFAPQKASITNNLLLESSLTARSLQTAQVDSLIGWLSFLYSSVVHQTVSLEFSSITMYLSLGERPV